MFDDELAGVRRIPARVPAARCGAGEIAQDLHRLGHVRALGVPVDQLVGRPHQSVTGDLVAEFTERGDRLGVALQARATAKTVSGMPRRSNTLSSRHSPAREPYSYNDSMLMCRLGKACAG